jgi:hypothetical protein
MSMLLSALFWMPTASASELGVQLRGGGSLAGGEHSEMLGARALLVFELVPTVSLGPAIDMSQAPSAEYFEVSAAALLRLSTLPFLHIDVSVGFGVMNIPNSVYYSDTRGGETDNLVPAFGGGVDLLFEVTELPLSIKLGPGVNAFVDVIKTEELMLNYGAILELAF